MSEPLVKLFDLYKRFGEVVAVNHINLDIQRGEFVTLLGPSGCGKTTTLRMIAGLEMPTSGKVYLEGHDVTLVPPEKRPVNMVFQAYALFPHLTVAENIAYGPKIRHRPPEEIRKGVERMLRLVQLEGFGSRKPSQLSGGQAQRVALARALINEPKVLLLDEPLGALDLKLRQAMQLELRSIQKTLGLTFIYVTHDQEEAMVLSDRVVLMNRGEIEQIGRPEEIYNHPKSIFASQFIGQSNLLPGTVLEVGADTICVDLKGLKLTAPYREDIQVGQEVKISVRPEKIQLKALTDRSNVNDGSSFLGVVEQTIFLGSVARYQIRLSNDQVILADETSIRGRPSYQANDQVILSWERDSCSVFLAETNPPKGGGK